MLAPKAKLYFNAALRSHAIHLLGLFLFVSFQHATAHVLVPRCAMVLASGNFEQQAVSVRDFEDLVLFARNLDRSKETVPERRAADYRNFLKVQGLPEFIHLNEILKDIVGHTYHSHLGILENYFVDQAIRWIQQKQKTDLIMNSPFFTRPMKYTALDASRLKRPRPVDRKLTPAEMNLVWETEDNYVAVYRRTSLPVDFEVRMVPREQVQFDYSMPVSEIPPWLIERFQKGDQILIPMNPFNTSTKIPFLGAPLSPETWKGFLMASRSAGFEEGNQLIGIKTPTNYANPSNRKRHDNAKADMREDLLLGIARTRLIDRIDRKIGKDPRLVVFRELLAIADRKTKNGILVRDLSPLMDGRYYLPGTATMAAIRHLSPEDQIRFLIQNTINQARLQAFLLIRYGIVLETPHRQNSLDVLDADMQMTSTVAVRDVADSHFVQPIAQLIAPIELRADLESNISVRQDAEMNLLAVEVLDSVLTHDQYAKLASLARRTYSEMLSTELQIPIGTPINSPVFRSGLIRYHQRLSSK